MPDHGEISTSNARLCTGGSHCPRLSAVCVDGFDVDQRAEKPFSFSVSLEAAATFPLNQTSLEVHLETCFINLSRVVHKYKNFKMLQQGNLT